MLLSHKSIIVNLAVILCGFISIPAQSDIVINKRPLKDFANEVIRKTPEKEIDLSAPFLLELETALDKDGKLDPKRTKFIRAEGDQNLIPIAKLAIEAINDSGYLQYLQKLAAKDLNVLIKQDSDSFSFEIKIRAEEKRAKNFTSGLKMLLQIARAKKERVLQDEKYLSAVRLETTRDELSILNSFAVSSEADSFMIKFSMVQSIWQEMIGRRINSLRNEQK